MDQQPYAFVLQQSARLCRALRAVRRDADVQRLAVPDDLRQGAHRFFHRHVRPWSVSVEDVHVVKTEPPQTVVNGGNQILLRGADPVRPGPHLVASLGGDHELVAESPKVLPQDFTESVFGTSSRWSVHVGEVEMCHTSVEGSSDDRTARLDGTLAAEVLPGPQGHRRQHQAALPAPAKSDDIPLFIWDVSHRLFLTVSSLQPPMPSVRLRRCPETGATPLARSHRWA